MQRARLAFRTVLTLLLAACGGFIFHLIGLPSAWIAGGILFVAAFSLAGFHSHVPTPIRDGTFLFLGIYAGSGVRPETLELIATWPASFAILGLTVAGVTAGAYLYLSRLHGWGRETALLSALPGALSFVLAAAETTNAEIRKVTVAQSVRLFALVELIPLLTFAVGATSSKSIVIVEERNNVELFVLLAAGSLGGFVLSKSRMPAGLLIGGLVVSAVLYLSGLIDTTIPRWLVVPALICLAANAGSRFQPGDAPVLKRIIGPAIGAFFVAALISIIAAVSASVLLGTGFAKTFLAFAPGALEVLTVLAFTLNIDPAYVAAHHVVRFVGLALIVPFVAQWLAHNPGYDPGEER